jgi:membrane associated rhomboid family serine protease
VRLPARPTRRGNGPGSHQARLEEAFGPWKALGLILLLAAGSSAEYAYAVGSVGLSGVGYGLFGLVWVLSHRDERFRGAIDGQTVALFIFWFLLGGLRRQAGE